MGFFKNMNKRSYQYMVRSTYPLLEPNRKTTKKVKKLAGTPVDKNGIPYNYQMKAKFQGKEYYIDRVEGKSVWLSDGKRHRLSSCEFV